MAATNPLLAEIQQWLHGCVGKSVWGAGLSEAGFSLEIGQSWKEPRTGRLCGEFGLLITCFWDIRKDNETISNSEWEYTRELVLDTGIYLEGKKLTAISLSNQGYVLTLGVDNGITMLIKPISCPPKEGMWTLFYKISPTEQAWCTFNRRNISYND